MSTLPYLPSFIIIQVLLICVFIVGFQFILKWILYGILIHCLVFVSSFSFLYSWPYMNSSGESITCITRALMGSLVWSWLLRSLCVAGQWLGHHTSIIPVKTAFATHHALFELGLGPNSSDVLMSLQTTFRLPLCPRSQWGLVCKICFHKLAQWRASD